jgi:hypothetical protein
MIMGFTDEQIARIAHEANRALQGILTDSNVPVDVPWEQYPPELQHRAVTAVKAARYGATPEAVHESWMQTLLTDGWTLGETKDATAKTHPDLVPFDQLPPGDRAKDYLFAGVCAAMNQASDIKTRAENEAQAISEAVSKAAAFNGASQPFGGATPVTVQVPRPPEESVSDGQL